MMVDVPNPVPLPLHRALLQRAVNQFEDDDKAVGMILGGSLAHGNADFYSDVDLYVVTRDETLETLFEERNAAARTIGSPWFGFDVEPVPGGSRDYIVTYPGPVKLDLMYYSESEMLPAPKWAGCVVLKDESGLITDVLARSSDLAPSLPPPEALLELDQKFWTWCWYVFGKIMRGELWEALDGVHSIRSQVLLPMLDWTFDRRHEGYRRLENKVDPETAARLARTVSTLDPESMFAALKAEMGLFRDLRGHLSESIGLTFDPRPEVVLRDEMSSLWAAREP